MKKGAKSSPKKNELSKALKNFFASERFPNFALSTITTTVVKRRPKLPKGGRGSRNNIRSLTSCSDGISQETTLQRMQTV